jgi:hypothetical protein
LNLEWNTKLKYKNAIQKSQIKVKETLGVFWIPNRLVPSYSPKLGPVIYILTTWKWTSDIFLGLDNVHENEIITLDPWVDVMITIVSDFCQFSAKILAFFTKTNLVIKFLQQLALVWAKNAKFFRQIFRRKYSKNHNIGPRTFGFACARVRTTLKTWTRFITSWGIFNTTRYIFVIYRSPYLPNTVSPILHTQMNV